MGETRCCRCRPPLWAMKMRKDRGVRNIFGPELRSRRTESRTRCTKRSGEIPSGHNLVDGSLRSIAKRYAVILHVIPSYWGMTFNCQHLPVISSYFDVICKCCWQFRPERRCRGWCMASSGQLCPGQVFGLCCSPPRLEWPSGETGFP